VSFFVMQRATYFKQANKHHLVHYILIYINQFLFK